MHIIIILFSITVYLYLYVKRKIKGHDFHAANRFRPIFNILLFVSIELFIPILSYFILKILYVISNSESVISGLGITIAMMIMVPFYYPFLSWRDKPQNGISYALYLRSFRGEKGTQHSFTRSILSMTRCLYPIYSIGDPNETISLFNRTIKIYKTDNDWKNAVSEYKEKAKIIILKLDGTDGLLWEVKSIMGHLSKILFVVEDKNSYDQFILKAHQYKIDFIDTFPIITDFPSIIWKQKDTWFDIKDIYYVSEYFNAHPWQKESVMTILDNVVQDQHGVCSISRFKSFFLGCKNVNFPVRFIDRILFFLFPFNQEYYAICNFSNNVFISMLINMYLACCAILYYFAWLILPYCFYNPDGLSLSSFQFPTYVFILSLPIFILSAVNGPKSFWLSHSYMKLKTIRSRFVRNAIMGCIIIAFLFGIGWRSKLNQIQQEIERKELYRLIGYNEDAINARNHVDSICNDVCSSALISGYIPIDIFHSRGLGNITFKYHQTIKDSLGTKEYYPLTKDSLMPDIWYANIAWFVIKELYHKNDN